MNSLIKKDQCKDEIAESKKGLWKRERTEKIKYEAMKRKVDYGETLHQERKQDILYFKKRRREYRRKVNACRDREENFIT